MVVQVLALRLGQGEHCQGRDHQQDDDVDDEPVRSLGPGRHDVGSGTAEHRDEHIYLALEFGATRR